MGFEALDLSIFRICEKMGWTLAFFDALPETERVEWLARDYYLQRLYHKRINGMLRVEDGQQVAADVAALIDLYTKVI